MQSTAGPRLDDAGILRAWEAAVSLARPWRELALLEEASCAPLDELAKLPIGERDRRLLAVRRQVFGDGFDLETACPECAERLELSIDAAAISPSSPRLTPGDLALDVGAWSVMFRLPDSTDLIVAAEASSEADAEATVLSRCVVAVQGPAGPVDPAQLPPESLDLLASRMETLDPGADLSLDLTCPACGHEWLAPVDPASLLFEEVEGQAIRLMGEVDQLARAYGWREPDVLALSPLRRRQYLEFSAG